MNSDILDVIKTITHQSAILKTEDIPFRDYVVEACAMNYCGRYNKTWQCPPGVGNLQDLKQNSQESTIEDSEFSFGSFK